MEDVLSADPDHPDWAPCAPALQTIEDALVIRHRVLAAFEQAENTDDPVERARRLTFVVVGGGPTGVEVAGAIAEFGRTVLPRDSIVCVAKRYASGSSKRVRNCCPPSRPGLRGKPKTRCSTWC